MVSSEKTYCRWWVWKKSVSVGVFNLIPNIPKEKVLGVRTPDIRKLAKELYGKKETEIFMKALPHVYHEENVLHACLIEKIKNYGQCMERIEEFLPYIDNWAVCDQMSPKVLAKQKEELIERIKGWLFSGDTYAIRFAVGMLMRYYLDQDYQKEYSDLVADITSEEYYVNMMEAWYFATALAKQYDSILTYLKEYRLPVWVHNKTIQKAVESRRITEQQKTELRGLKRKREQGRTRKGE